MIEGKSSELLSKVSERLARKVRGARSLGRRVLAGGQLPHGEDGQAPPDCLHCEEVLAWLGASRAGVADLTYIDGAGRRRPTKRGQALMFALCGQAHREGEDFAEMAAAELTAARAELQRLKHADDGSPEEVNTVRRLVAAVEGYVVLSIRLGWVGLSDEGLAGLRARLGEVPAVATIDT